MKQQLNSAKWYLNEKIKEFQEFIKQQNEENTCNLLTLILMSKFDRTLDDIEEKRFQDFLNSMILILNSIQDH